MKLSDLFVDKHNNKLSHTKLWSNIGLLSMTVAFLYRAFYGNIADYETEILVYGIVVTAPNLLGKFLTARFGIQHPVNSNKEKEEA